MADPTVSQVYQTSIPQELLPYAQRMLDTASQFTDIEKNPYQQYQGERVAQLSPMVQQAMDTASQMGVSGQIGAASDLAGAAGVGAMQQDTFANPYAASAYMSPFMQNVVDVQQQEAKRQAAIQNQGIQAQAAKSGAFGGARDYVMRGEANRALQNQLQGIQATGLQSAFQNAQQQFNTEQQRRLQGMQTGLQAASTLGNLGQEQYQQTAGIVGLQGQLGQFEQQRAQDVLNAQYQDFLNYQNYPYKQLGFMSDLIRGTPTTQSASTIYQAPPTTMQNLMSLGLGAYGMNQLFPTQKSSGNKEGGLMKAYAGGGMVSFDGGGSVMSPEFKRYAVDHIDPRQLPIAQRNAMARGDQETAGFAQDEMALDAAIRRGIGAAFTPQMADHVVRAAGGGILAFKEDGLVDTSEENAGYTTEGSSGAGGDFTDEQIAQLAAMGGDDRTVESGDQNMYRNASSAALRTAEGIRQKKFTDYTPAEMRQMVKDYYKQEMDLAGPDPYDPALKDVAQAKLDRVAALEQGKGLAALKAASAVLQPGGTMRGLGAAGTAFADSYAQALDADRKEKRALASMQFNITDAQRKERMGMTKSALASAAAAQKNKKEAFVAEVNKEKAIGDIQAKVAQANRPIRVGGAGSGGPKINEDIWALEQKFARMKPGDSGYDETKKLVEAGRAHLGRVHTSESGPGRLDIESKKILSRISDKATEEARKGANAEAQAKNLFGKPGGQAEVDAIFERRYRDLMGLQTDTVGMGVDDMIRETGGVPKHGITGPNGGAGAGAAKAVPLPKNPKPADLKNGTVYMTKQGPATWNSTTQTFTTVSP
jgi:hypothetical protein